MSAYDGMSRDLDPTPRVRKMSGPFTREGLKSVAEAVAFCESKGLDPAEVRLAHNYVSWDQTETDVEVAARIAWAEERRDKHVAWVRDTYRDYEERGLIGGAR